MRFNHLCVLFVFILILFSGCISSKKSVRQTRGEINSLIKMALDSGNSYYCQKINNSDSRYRCLAELYLKLYEEYGDEKYCILMEKETANAQVTPPYALKCFQKAGYEGQDLCRKFKTSYVCYSDCFLNHLRRDVVLTEQDCVNFSRQEGYVGLDNNWRCYSNLAILAKNSSLCDRITSKGHSYDCHYYAKDIELVEEEIRRAVESGNSTICNGVHYRLILECYQRLYDRYQDERYCIEMEVANSRRVVRSMDAVLECFSKEGYTGEELCRKFKSDYYLYRKCHEEYLGEKTQLSPEACAAYSSMEGELGRHNRWQCYTDLAVQTGNQSFCDNIPEDSPDNQNRGHCQKQVRAINKDVGI